MESWRLQTAPQSMLTHSLDSIFPDYRATGVSIVSEKLMGFSGATIQEISVNKWETIGCADICKDKEVPPSLLFVKHIVFNELPAAASEVSRQKEIRNRHSYTNESNFIERVIPRLEQTGHFYFPRTHVMQHQLEGQDVTGLTELTGAETFTFFTDSLSPIAEQVPVLNNSQLMAVLAWTARLHAVFHGSVDTSEEEGGGGDHVAVLARHPELGLWRQGTHLALEKRPLAERQAIGPHWTALCVAFGWIDLVPLGDRLAAAAPYVARQLSVVHGRNRGRTTVVHGDVKPGNIFFLHQDSTQAQRQGQAVTLIDYQWAGPGLGVTDVVYLLATSASDQFIEDLTTEEGSVGMRLEERLLQPYQTAFEAGCALQEDHSYQALQHDFRLAVLDYTRWAVSCRLGGETPEKYTARQDTLDGNLGAYRRSPRMLRLLLGLVEEYLPSVEEEISKELEGGAA